MKRFVFTMDLPTAIRWGCRLVLFIFSMAFFIWFVWALQHGLIDNISEWLRQAIEWIAKFCEAHKKTFMVLLVGAFCIGVLWLWIDEL